VAMWSGRLLSKISYLIAHGKQKEMRRYGFDWFISQYGGLHSCVLSLRRHNNMSEWILEIMLHFGIDNFYDLFTTILKNES